MTSENGRTAPGFNQFAPTGTVGSTAMARSMAPAILMYPAPQSKGLPRFSAVYIKIALMALGVNAGTLARIIAAAPETTGAAILVPLSFICALSIWIAG